MKSVRNALTTLKNKARRPVEALKDKLFAFGWYASSFGSASKVVRYAEIFFKDLTNQQKAMINDTTSDISAAKKGIFWVGNIAASIWALYQISEKRDRFGNVVRFLRIAANMTSIALDMVIMGVADKFTHSVLGVIASGFNFVVNIFNMIKNVRNYNKVSRQLACKEADSPEKEDNKELAYTVRKKGWKIVGRVVSLGFGAVVLGLAVLLLLTANPEIPIIMMAIGIVSLVTRWSMQIVRRQKLNQFRKELGLEPKLNYMTTYQLKEHYKEKLDARNQQQFRLDSRSDLIEHDYQDAHYALRDAIWHDRLFHFDAAMTLMSIGFTVAAVSLINPVLYVGVALAGATAVVSKVILHRARLAELAIIKPDGAEENQFNKPPPPPSDGEVGVQKRSVKTTYTYQMLPPKQRDNEEALTSVKFPVVQANESWNKKPVATWHKDDNGVPVASASEEAQRSSESIFML